MNLKKKIAILSILLCAAALFAGCGLWPVSSTPKPNSTVSAGLSATPSPTVSLTLQPDQALTETAKQNRVILWLPPEFGLTDEPASALLQDRLNAFEQEHSGVDIDVRIKEVNGPAGMLAALETTLDVAPDVAPSLALMLQTDLETAVMRGLLQAPPGFAQTMEQEDWYAYAREMSHVQSEYFGVPFAADALIVAVRSNEGETEMQSWDNLLAPSRPLLFPVSDNQALFTLNLYLSAGGKLFDEENRPALDPVVFRKVLEFYKTSADNGTMAASVADISGYSEAWGIFYKRMANQTICWLSDYLRQAGTGEYGGVIPSLGSQTVTLVSGWVWAVTEPNTEKLEIDMELLESLTDPEFQAAWTQAAGYLPVRPSGLEAWEQPAQMALLSQATISAVSQPGNEILNVFGPALSEAVYNVINEQAQPLEAARLAAEKINPK